jgi:hypothetical protein
MNKGYFVFGSSPHPPLQVGEARVAADWIPYRLVIIKASYRFRY